MTALEAAKKLMKQRGGVVAGIPADKTIPIFRGFDFADFAGHPIPGFVLRVKAAADRAAWKSQADFLGLEDKNASEEGQRFFLCDLVPK